MFIIIISLQLRILLVLNNCTHNLSQNYHKNPNLLRARFFSLPYHIKQVYSYRKQMMFYKCKMKVYRCNSKWWCKNFERKLNSECSLNDSDIKKLYWQYLIEDLYFLGTEKQLLWCNQLANGHFHVFFFCFFFFLFLQGKGEGKGGLNNLLFPA